MKKKIKKEKTISEPKVIDAVLKWAYKHSYGLKPKIKHGNKHGVDLELNHEKTRHKYYIECKGGPHDEVNFVYSLGQIITRMNRKPLGVNYGIALPAKSAEIARKRIPRDFATRNKLTIFSVSNNGAVKRLVPSDFRKEIN
ncbi:MAG: hypothetical protein A2653_03085 [Candidatus Zambryskibacteria bacterium RIFCSPHIGHO2_01_FULL_43_25]|uniref:Restriction endonuclease type IV Mrr domain-containing protein n=1 Tax=Candidatus Zambryskibacteria bacterium RIFCSPLOWO2_01_FULL_45_21 TaxID=1802761 RepID=A0A1G2U2G7_9BACT|nr:MAG: hypothetical protein A2653_03085 [Candidatus Zambryskibacteria bacterium RIFCSPHIGHO2_01_FULL_43_25]OHB03708.1 MAG: hypothetical protein A3B14_01535 [Candidatus Zambryskibacteria bacterium RIFCSPLOWO2_01_FULL_45_21]